MDDYEDYRQRLEEYRGIVNELFDNLIDRLIKAELKAAEKSHQILELNTRIDMEAMRRAMKDMKGTVGEKQ